MAELTVFIDETGNFSFNSKTSYIGGWVCKTENQKDIKNLIKNSVTYFNNYLQKEKVQNFTLDYHKHMHFMPLHIIEERSKDRSITINPWHVPVFFEHLFNSIDKINLQIFRSTGKPAFMPNEQATYIDILRNTLLQLIDQLVGIYKHLTLHIVIAHRRNKNLYGEEGIKDTIAYEKHIIEALKKELKEAFTADKPNITITFDNARDNSGLIMADFYCGAQRWRKNKYLTNKDKITKYAFNNGYQHIGNRLIQKLQYIQQQDPLAATIFAIDILSSNPENNEIKSLFEKIINGMNKTDKSMFCKSMIDLFDEKLVNDPERYANLNSMQNIIVLLSSMFNSSYEKLSQEELKLISTLLMNQIRIDSHLGITDNTSTDKFIEFLDNWGQITFNNQMDIMQQRIDAVLMGVQIKAFNTFKFDLIEDHLKEIKEQYKKMFDFSSDTNILKDNNIARLEGTLGQMYGFYYDIEQDDDYFELAEECLLDDIKATIDNTSSSEQAHGYLTSLYWKSGNLDKASEQFIKETNGEPKDKNKIFDLNDNKTFSTDEKPFIQLHRLYLCALAVKSDNQNIKGIEKEKEFLLKQDDLHQYPKLLSAKWLAIVYILQNDYQSANELLTKSLAIETNDDTIDVIKISSKILKHYVDLTLNQKTNFSCEEEIKRLANKQKEFKEVLFKRGAEKYYTNNIDDWNVYEIGGLLPFYFS